MDSFFTRFRNPLTLMALVLLQVFALAVQVQKPAPDGLGQRDGRKVTLLRRWTLAVVTPFERGVYASSSGVRHAWSNYIDLRHTRDQNRALQQELARLRTEEAEFAEDAREGRRLAALLQFKQTYISSTVLAQVIGTSGYDRSRLLTLNKGSEDGLKSDMAVMTPDGVVGKLREVSAHTSQLLLLSDPSAGAGVILASTRIRGILRGTSNGSVQIVNLTEDSRIKPGEQVLTSGGDGVFPRGLPVGVIQSIAPDPTHQPYMAITIKTNANLSRLEEVLVITGTQQGVTPELAADAAQAEALADANKRAADMVAEKLPSIHDEKAPEDPNKPADPTNAAAPTAVIPRPKPVVHPDRYSPNSSAPASEMQPGAPAPKSDTDSKAGDH
ncbi:rod shape-determining protein MreC [Granulicella cerasi]|uniref:Cell shape-determining protein MreC n=1 Tax=Granulicella cerasi TaxID=741063 RepID=A0ABW1Z842_9BACT|nr:rod shape-determining protein MreC [Granulicella cerasi]